MKTNINIIKRLARLGVLEVEQAKYKKEDDIIIKNYEGVEQKVIIDGLTDEDLAMMVEVEKLSTLQSIKGMVKAFYISALICGGIWLLFFLIDLGSHM